MGFLKEFRTFAVKGNVIDMAVGVIIGGAFGKIVSSLVNDIIMPPLGAALGNIDFKELKLILKPAIGDIPAVTLNYGVFINNIIDFIIIAVSVFVFIKSINSFKKKQEEAPAAPPKPSNEEVLLTEIRDILKNK